MLPRRRGSLLFLRLFGELDHDALQNEGSRVKQDGMITRFVLFFGGLVTAIAGVIAKQFGAAVGGLFLAFPAIFPASATLIKKREKQKKEKKRPHGAPRGREAASMDAAGAAMGSIGLLLFALKLFGTSSRTTEPGRYGRLPRSLGSEFL